MMTPDDPRHGTLAGYSAKCRCDECRAASAAYQRDRRYNLEPGEYDRRVREQGGKCAIRGCTAKATVLDHCHTTMANRKLLCNNCNVALGMAGDSPARLKALANYLEGHQ